MISKFNRSFSLLEVLITVAILSTATTFVFRSFTTSLYSSRFSQNITLACYLAEDKIWEIEQSYKDALKLPDHPGKETVQDRNFNWDYEISETKSPDLKQLKFTVTWKENIREKDYSMEFLTYLIPKKQ